jgi:hypothetical protein
MFRNFFQRIEPSNFFQSLEGSHLSAHYTFHSRITYAWNVTLPNTAQCLVQKGLWNALHNRSVAPKTLLSNLDPTETFDAFLNRFCRTGVHQRDLKQLFQGKLTTNCNGCQVDDLGSLATNDMNT